MAKEFKVSSDPKKALLLGTNMKLFLKTKDFPVSQEVFELRYNDSKDMLITTPRPKDLKPYYESEDYISHTDSSKSLVDKLYQWVKRYSLEKKLSLINGLGTKGKSLLDIGAGTGDFCISAKNAHWMVDGVEPSAKAREKAKQKGCILRADLDALFSSKFDVITLWHVLEHVPDLENTVAKILTLLHHQGALVIAVPNFKSYDADYYGTHWAAFDVPRHLWHFSKPAIIRMFKKYDWEVVRTKPMLFDAFYVAILSERYKSGKQNLLKAFFVGLISNINGFFTKEYSSHIYILKKRK
ncbi:Methyltransferase type 12 [Croceitalea dokdonensis DOKDO 023]|uniref:Methyltransferase type 12 n=2 Tax=Croceitalea TaxID=574891 RepID=A0A0P7A3B2_9FLAO|nr:Methyltransferase type 12 [Croceitalea dokdonensis DOKDO 023]